MTASTRKALIDQLREAKGANVVLQLEILNRCKALADQALAEGNEMTRWAADAEAWRGRGIFDEISANLDRMIELLEARGSA